VPHIIPRDESDTSIDAATFDLAFSGKSHNPALVNVPCVTTDGASEYIETGVNMSGWTGFTVFRRAKYLSGAAYDIDGQRALAVSTPYEIRMGRNTGDGQFYGGLGDDTDVTFAVDGIGDNELHTMAIANSTTGPGTVWVNGSNVYSAGAAMAAAFPTFTTAATFNIGRDNEASPTHYSNAEYYEYRIYDRQLTDDEISYLDSDGASGTDPSITGGLQMHYTLQDGAGDQVADISGNENHGTITGDLSTVWGTLTTGEVKDHSLLYGGGGCAWFDGTDDQIELTSNISETDCSVSFWFNAAALSGKMFVSDRTSGSHWIRSTGVNTINLAVNGVSHNFTVVPPGMDTDTWYHCVVTKDDDTFRVYVDGVESTTGSVVAASSTWILNTLGGYNGTSFQFNGMIRDCRVFSKVLTDDEVAYLFWSQRNTTDGTDPGSADLLDLPLERNAQDVSGSNNHGTVSGSVFPYITSMV
jgi:hypothetical protein